MKFFLFLASVLFMPATCLAQRAHHEIAIQNAHYKQVTADSNHVNSTELVINVKIASPYDGQKIEILSKKKRDNKVLATYRIIEQRDGYYVSGKGIHQKLWNQTVSFNVRTEKLKNQKHFLTYSTPYQKTRHLKIITS